MSFNPAFVLFVLLCGSLAIVRLWGASGFCLEAFAERLHPRQCRCFAHLPPPATPQIASAICFRRPSVDSVSYLDPLAVDSVCLGSCLASHYLRFASGAGSASVKFDSSFAW